MALRAKILKTAHQLFNEQGVVAVSTNHLAQSLGISPGNLYYHFRNKEEILLQLFDLMTENLYASWRQGKTQTPRQFFRASFQVFWDYRFFHREIYTICRRDREFHHRWKEHLAQSRSHLAGIFRSWQERGLLSECVSRAQLENLVLQFLSSASAFLLFYENPEKKAPRLPLAAGVNHMMAILDPYLT